MLTRFEEITATMDLDSMARVDMEEDVALDLIIQGGSTVEDIMSMAVDQQQPRNISQKQ